MTHALELAGVSVFTDEALSVEVNYFDALGVALAGAKAFVLIIPERRNTSWWLQLEIQAALGRSATGNLLFFPVLLPGREVTVDLNGYRWINASPGEKDFRSAADLIAKALAGSAAPEEPSEQLRAARQLIALMDTDLYRAPLAAASVLDTLATFIGSEDDAPEQIEMLRSALSWGEMHLGEEHRSVVSLRVRFKNVLAASERYEESLSLVTKSLRTAATARERAEALAELAGLRLASGDLEGARALYHQVLEASPDTGSRQARLNALASLAAIARQSGDTHEAAALYRNVLGSADRYLDPQLRAIAILGLAQTTHDLPVGAMQPYLNEVLWLARTAQSSDPFGAEAKTWELLLRQVEGETTP